MRKLMMVAAMLATGAVIVPAYAQEIERDPYDGFYVGGSFGGALQPNDIGSSIQFDRDLNGGFGDTVTTAGGANAFSTGFCNGSADSALPGDGCGNDKDDIEYYVRAGADTQIGAIVIGVVGEFGKAEITDSVSAFSTTPARYTMTRSLKYNANIRGRIGFTPGTQRTTLFYAAGGPSYARIENSFSTSNGANSFAVSGDDDAFGFNVGGGVEQKIGRNFSIGLEYLYTDLQDDDARVRVGPGTALASNPFLLSGAGGTDFRRSDTDFRWHSMRVTAAFRF